MSDMAMKVDTLRTIRGIRFNLFFQVSRTPKKKLELFATVFIIRWGLQLHIGPRYLIG